MIKLNYQFSLRAVSSYFASLYYPTNMSGVDNAEDQGEFFIFFRFFVILSPGVLPNHQGYALCNSMLWYDHPDVKM